MFNAVTGQKSRTSTRRLHCAVRRALHARLRFGASVLLGGLAATAPAGAASFPAVLPLATLYPAGGGDGSEGFVLTGSSKND